MRTAAHRHASAWVALVILLLVGCDAFAAALAPPTNQSAIARNVGRAAVVVEGSFAYDQAANVSTRHAGQSGSLAESARVGRVRWALRNRIATRGALPAMEGVNPWAGRIVAGETQTTMTMYRVWGGEAKQAGEWLTSLRPASAAEARAGLALPPGNAASFVSEVTVPAGTQVQVGTAAAAFGQTGGAIQMQLLERIPASAFGPGVPLP